jgi:hypothetical protein
VCVHEHAPQILDFLCKHGVGSELSRAFDASQYGIGIVSARIAEMVLRNERSVVPI